LFAVAIFTSAALVFVVQPMVTKLVLPMLGGSPAVWNTAMVFFQTALLAGYGYAHLLQKVGSIKTQVAIHLGLLLAAAPFLPLSVNGLLGDPDPAAPILWLLATLTLSVGAPFVAFTAICAITFATSRKRPGETPVGVAVERIADAVADLRVTASGQRASLADNLPLAWGRMTP